MCGRGHRSSFASSCFSLEVALCKSSHLGICRSRERRPSSHEREKRAMEQAVGCVGSTWVGFVGSAWFYIYKSDHIVVTRSSIPTWLVS